MGGRGKGRERWVDRWGGAACGPSRHRLNGVFWCGGATVANPNQEGGGAHATPLPEGWRGCHPPRWVCGV